MKYSVDYINGYAQGVLAERKRILKALEKMPIFKPAKKFLKKPAK